MILIFVDISALYKYLNRRCNTKLKLNLNTKQYFNLTYFFDREFLREERGGENGVFSL